MTVRETISRVKWCIDHETREDAHLADSGEDTYMDNIIRAKIDDARRWLAIVTRQSVTASTLTGGTMRIERYGDEGNIGVLTLPQTIAPESVSRVRLSSWHKAAQTVEDTSDDATLMYDPTGCGTADRPLATVMRGTPTQILVQPYTDGETAEIGYTGIASATDEAAGDEAAVDVAPMHESALVYYIAYLLLTAYQDQRAQGMLAVAVQMAGTNKKD